jgi:hypothetical protein
MATRRSRSRSPAQHGSQMPTIEPHLLEAMTALKNRFELNVFLQLDHAEKQIVERIVGKIEADNRIIMDKLARIMAKIEELRG